MADPNTYDFCIIGAGLAGLSLAGTLAAEGAKIIVVDNNEVASGASGTPIGLVNPATGRFGTKSWKAEECYASILADIEKTQASTSQPVFRKSGILRPATDLKIAAKMKENLKKTSWPANWCEWLDEQEIREKNADIKCVGGGLWLPEGLTVDISSYLKAKAELLKKEGVDFRLNTDAHVQKTDAHFEIRTPEVIFPAQSVICCAGIGSKSLPDWDFLPLIPVKGQVAEFRNNSVKLPDFAISALGYIASLDSQTFIIGSTYEHKFEHLNPDENGLNYMLTRLKTVFPKIFEEAQLTSQWAGVRASTPNRMPILGRHPEIENYFIYAGLGSKGLLYSSYLSSEMSNFIIHSKELPAEVSIERLRN